MAEDRPYWETKALDEMTPAEWEALCDGCGRCCLVIIEDEDDPGLLAETSVHCRLFDPKTRRCRDYANRAEKVPGCVTLTAANVGELSFMPDSCAYRRLSEGRGLAPWHPLVSGRPESVEEAGVAAPRRLKDERRVPVSKLWKYITHERRRD